MLWQWIEHLREQWESSLAPPPPAAERAAPAGDTDAALAAELQAAALLSEEGGGQRAERSQRGAVDAELEAVMAQVVGSVVHGEPFTEKRSTFQVGAAGGRVWRRIHSRVLCIGSGRRLGELRGSRRGPELACARASSHPSRCLQAHLAPAKSMRDVEALMELLLQNNKIRAGRDWPGGVLCTSARALKLPPHLQGGLRPAASRAQQRVLTPRLRCPLPSSQPRTTSWPTE